MYGILLIFGGLALFLFGIKMLSAGMEKLAGEQIQKWLDRVVNGRLKSGFWGGSHGHAPEQRPVDGHDDRPDQCQPPFG